MISAYITSFGQPIANYICPSQTTSAAAYPAETSYTASTGSGNEFANPNDLQNKTPNCSKTTTSPLLPDYRGDLKVEDVKLAAEIAIWGEDTLLTRRQCSRYLGVS